MATVNLSKAGEKVLLEKGNDSGTALVGLQVGLGWDANSTDGSNFDLDASIFCVGSDGKSSIPEFLFYNSPKVNGKPTILDGALVHSGDNLTGDGDGDDETIMMDLTKIPADVTEMVAVVHIHDAEDRNQSFSMVDNAYISIKNPANNEELIHFDLSWDAPSSATGVKFAKIFKRGDQWAVEALQTEFNGGLRTICEEYGIQ